MKTDFDKTPSLRGGSADKAIHLDGTPHSLPALAMAKIKKLGFTLVEMSIVLVIVGLLATGILVGQSLIESAKITSFIRELKQYEVAVVQFHQKFKQYPGDSRYFNPAGNGDGDTSDGGGACVGALSRDESYQAWAHLSQSQMLKTNYPALSPVNDGGLGECGGTHSHEDLHTGKISPYTKVDPQANVLLSGYSTSDRRSITANKNSASANLYFIFYTLPLDTLAVENKLGSQAYVSLQQIGLVNGYGVGKCSDSAYSSVNCSDPDALFGESFYYLVPP